MGNRLVDFKETMIFWVSISFDVKYAKKEKDIFAQFVKIQWKSFRFSLNKHLVAHHAENYIIGDVSQVVNVGANNKIDKSNPRVYLYILNKC